MHAGEIEARDDGRISGIAVNLAARVEQHAADGEFELKGVDGRWRQFAVSRARASV